jgi:endo-1,4-beta-mannosidase
MTLPLLKIQGTYFTNGKQRFLPVGVHWVPAVAAMQWPYQWDPASLEADFAKMKDLGCNTVRFDLVWAWFEPRPGDYNPSAFEQLDTFVRLAHQYEIYLHPTLFVGGEVGEAYWDVPWRHGRHPHSDPEMLRLQTEHAAELARRYQGETAILGWDLTDEPPFWIVSDQTTDAMAINWTRLIAGALRRFDPEHPLCVGTSMEDVSHGPFRPDIIAGEVDFFSAHPYSIYSLGLFPDAMLSERGTYCGAFQTLLSSGAGHPVMIHELGSSSAQYTPENVACFDRVTMYSALAAGSQGFLLWCYTDAAPQTFHQTPYLRAPHETQFGITTWDRQDRPQGVEFRKFSRIASQLILEGVEPAKAEAAIIVPDEWSRSHGDLSRLGLSGPSVVPYVSTQAGGVVGGAAGRETGEENHWLTSSWLNAMLLTRRAGLKVSFPREYADWQKTPLLFMPSPLTSTVSNKAHVHTRFWEAVSAYVQNGGAVFATLCADAAIPEMKDLFGARLADHAPVGQVSIRIIKAFSGLVPGDVFRYQPHGGDPRHWLATLQLTGGEVIAVDQEDRPALVAHTLGKGKTLLCAYPIESYLAMTPAVFDQPEETHRLYRAFADWAGVQPLFRTDHPSVEVAGLVGNAHGYAVLANHAPLEHTVKVTTSLPLDSLIQVTPTGQKEIQFRNAAWTITIPAYDGAVLEWRLKK